MSSQRIMNGWDRKKTTWTKKRGQQAAVVKYSDGGWRWTILNSDGQVIQSGSHPSIRSRKARRAAQKALARTPLKV